VKLADAGAVPDRGPGSLEASALSLRLIESEVLLRASLDATLRKDCGEVVVPLTLLAPVLDLKGVESEELLFVYIDENDPDEVVDANASTEL
jgi:hypothetical protein